MTLLPVRCVPGRCFRQLRFSARIPTALFVALLGGVAGLAGSASADDPLNPVAASFRDLGDSATFSQTWNASTPDEHQQWHATFEATAKRLLGEMPQQVPAEVKWLEEKQFDGFKRHKIMVRTEADYWAPVYYYVPDRLAGPTAAMVCLHGHSGIVPYIDEGTSDEARERTRRSELDYAVHFAKAGYISAAIVVRGWDETADRQDPGIRNPRRSCYQVTMNSFLLGMTPQGLRCWDAMRVIDFLQTQPQVDSDRIGVAGLSGGGTLAMYLPVLEPRVKLVMIGGAFSGYRESIYDIHHCICNCLPGIMQYGDMSDIVALYAPRPVLLINGIHDPIFPIQQAREGFEKLQQVYQLLGHPDRIDADFFDGPHAWSNRKTVPFLHQHFGQPQRQAAP